MKRQVHTIFCDDVRNEVGGKLSYMGVYSGTLLVTEFPIVLPKLCVALTAITSAAEPFKKMTFRLLKDTETLAECVLSKEDLARARRPSGKKPRRRSEERTQSIQTVLMFAALKLDGPCQLAVRVNTETEELRGVGLRIGLATAE